MTLFGLRKDQEHGDRRPTPEQEARLARIVNPEQRRILLDAIAHGDVIPEFAWRPLPVHPPSNHEILAELAERLRPLAERHGMTPRELLASLEDAAGKNER